MPDETNWVPVHEPLAVQLVESVADHVRVDDWPAVMEVGVAVNVTVGAGGRIVNFVEFLYSAGATVETLTLYRSSFARSTVGGTVHE